MKYTCKNPVHVLSIATIACFSAIYAFTCSIEEAEAREHPDQGLFSSLGRKFLKTTRDREEYVILNMQKTQKASENFASHHQGKYPLKMDDSFKSYFPLGNCDGKNYSSYTIPFNPFAKKPAWPILVNSTPQGSKLVEGSVYYKPLSGKGYEIYGVGAGGKLLKDKSGKTLKLEASRESLSLGNARAVQWAAERYAERYKRYPIGMTGMFKNCFPGGNTKPGKEGRRLFNPYDKKLFWPITGTIKNINSARNSKPTPLAAGIIEYSCTEGGKNYAIRIGGIKNLATAGIRGSKSTLVIARDGDGRGAETKW